MIGRTDLNHIIDTASTTAKTIATNIDRNLGITQFDRHRLIFGKSNRPWVRAIDTELFGKITLVCNLKQLCRHAVGDGFTSEDRLRQVIDRTLMHNKRGVAVVRDRRRFIRRSNLKLTCLNHFEVQILFRCREIHGLRISI